MEILGPQIADREQIQDLITLLVSCADSGVDMEDSTIDFDKDFGSFTENPPPSPPPKPESATTATTSSSVTVMFGPASNNNFPV